MKAVKILSVVAALALWTSTARAALTINEVRIDQPGSDASEYFELAGIPGESLNGVWFIAIGDTSTGSGSGFGDRSGGVETAIDLTGNVIKPDGHFLVAETTFGTGSLGLTGTVDLSLAPNAVNFENSDNRTFFLVTDFTGAVNDDLDDGSVNGDNDGILDVTPWTSIIDELALIETPMPPATLFDEWVYSSNQVGPDGTFVPGHVFRLPDASGPWNIGGFFGGDDTPSAVNPEPATLALLGIGGLLVLRRRRR
ncbi:MAG: PEP-CTERM sorting domain-containing protein [Phycisphaerae bacterium]